MVYENVLSVAFIYALGVKRGRTANPEDVIIDSINFFQQTPKDKSVGDLLAKWNGKAFITEFKATEDRVIDEIRKYGKKDLILSFKADSTMREYSRRGHFIGYGDYEKKDNLILADLRFKPYLDLLSPTYIAGERFNQFTSRLIDEKTLGLDDVEMGSYLQFLKTHAENVVETKSGGSGGGRTIKPIEGVVTIVAPDSTVISLRYRTYEQLAYLMSQKISLEQLLQLQMDYRLNYTLGSNNKVEKKKGKNLGRKME